MATLLHQLTEVPLLSPCDEPWERMRGDDRVRRCEACARDVFDVSAMSALEAELRLLNADDAVPCVRYRRDREGDVLHQLPRSGAPRPSRSLVAATALGVTLGAVAPAAADQVAAGDAPAECIAYAAAFAEAPATKPAPAKAAAKPGAEEPGAAPIEEPRPLAGKPMPPRERPAFGTLSLKSKTAREVVLVGIVLQAPLSRYLLSPGDFSLEVREPQKPKKKPRKVRFKIERDQTTTIDLDKR
jgi:hypothetical protein